MLDRDLHADRIFADVGVLEDELATGMLDVENHGRRAVGARLIAHEADGALAADQDAVDPRDARAKARLHLFPPAWPSSRTSHPTGRGARGRGRRAGAE